MSFAISLRVEVIKTKRSAAFWLSVIGAAFVPAIFFLMYFFRPEVFTVQLKNNSWENHFMTGWQALSAFMLPMFVILTCSLISQIEFKNNTWKQVFASPQTLGNIFFSKFLTIQLMILFCFLLFDLCMITCAVVVNLLNKNYQFLHQPLGWTFLLKLSFNEPEVIFFFSPCFNNSSRFDLPEPLTPTNPIGLISEVLSVETTKL